jgi:hypothetical protein
MQTELLRHENAAINSPYVSTEIPGCLTSFFQVAKDYWAIRHDLTTEQKDYFVTSGALLTTIWAYTQISKRSIKELHHDQVLFPAIALYVLVAAQDDIVDNLRKDHYIPCVKQAFWPETTSDIEIQPRQTYRRVVKSIDANPILHKDQRKHIKTRIAAAYRSYYDAEQTLFELANSPYVNVDQVRQLRYQSFGLMAEAITTLLNGSISGSPQSEAIEKQLAKFSMVTELLDSDKDLNEDRGVTMSVPLALWLSGGDQRHYETLFAQELDEQLHQIGSTKVATMLHLLNWSYPYIKSGLSLISKTCQIFGLNACLGLGKGRRV